MPTIASMHAMNENALRRVVKKLFPATDSLLISCMVFTSSIATEGSIERSSDRMIEIRPRGSATVLTSRCLEKAVDWLIDKYTSGSTGPLSESVISQGLVGSAKKINLLPIGFSCGKYRFAMASLMIATAGELVVSVGRKLRPSPRVIPISWKKSEVTARLDTLIVSLSCFVEPRPSISKLSIDLLPVSGTPQAKAAALTPGKAETLASASL